MKPGGYDENKNTVFAVMDPTNKSWLLVAQIYKEEFLKNRWTIFWNSEEQQKNGKVPFLSLAKLKAAWIIYSSPPQCEGCQSSLTGKYAYPQQRLI